MHQGHYISMNTIMLSFVMLNKVISIIYCLLYESLSSYAAILYINAESWPIVGFYPHVGSTGGLKPTTGKLSDTTNGRTGG